MYINSRNYSSRPRRGSRIPVHKSNRLAYGKYAFVIFCVLMLLVVARNVFAADSNSQDSNSSVSDSQNQEEAPVAQEAPKRQIDTSNLQASLDQIIKKYPYDTSVSVVDLNSGTTIQTGDSYPFIAASTTKLLTALLYLSNVEKGQTDLNTTIGGKPAREQLRLAVNQSDNSAWRELNNYLVRDNLDAYAKQQGLTSYDVTRNTITSNDMALLMAKIHKRELLNDEHTKLLLSWMQNTSEERFIPSAIPQGITLYHKAGYLAERVHDVAIIDNGSAPYVLVIYSKSYTASYDYAVGQKLFRQVTEQAVATFK